jgi:hypothetical protein
MSYLKRLKINASSLPGEGEVMLFKKDLKDYLKADDQLIEKILDFLDSYDYIVTKEKNCVQD